MFVEVETARRHANLTQDGITEDSERVLESACSIVEDWCGPIGQTTVTETVGTDGLLRARPIELTVVSSGVVGDYTLDDRVWRISPVTAPLTVTYTAGYAVAPTWAVDAALIIFEHLWRTRRGAGANARRAGTDVQVPGAGYLIPTQAAQLMEPHRFVGVY